MSMYHTVIRYPSITEKNTVLRTSQNKFVFEVATDATKPQIRKAVEKLFNVKVLSVNTIVVKGKMKRQGRTAGHRPNWKKAIVKIQAGQTIAKFGEV
jgi:large subunit ribosomal protein L23